MAVLVGMTILVMVAMVGLALDLGQMFVSKSELQNSADACALAAANSMRSSLASAEAAGGYVAARHKVVFQDKVVGADDGTIKVEFSINNVKGPFQSAGALAGTPLTTVQYVRCQVSQSKIRTFFIQVLDLLPGPPYREQFVSATAVAKLMPSQKICALPVAICDGDLTGKSVGDWIYGTINDKDGDFLSDPLHPSTIKWVDFSPPGGGASEVSKWITGDGECNVPAGGADIAEAGVKSSIAAAYNSRFGIYGNGIKTTVAPDVSGWAYTPVNWPSQKNAYTDYDKVQSGAYSAYQGDDVISTTPLGLASPPAFYVDTSPGKAEDSGFLKLNGKEPRRVLPAPVVTCDGSATLKLKSWACIFLLHPITVNQKTPEPMYLEYLGSADAASSPCATNGLPGGTGSDGPLVAGLVQ